MKREHVIAILLILVGSVRIYAGSPVTDLSSPVQEIRDAAAQAMRETYVPPARTNWNTLLTSLKLGTPKQTVISRFNTLNFSLVPAFGSGNAETDTCQLDDLWVIECTFTPGISGTNLSHVELRERMRDVLVPLPTNFTGSWTTYHVNGQRHYKFSYKSGQLNGESRSFYPNGHILLINHFRDGKAQGEEICFFSSGRTNYIGHYEDDSRVGLWTWYGEDGLVKSQKQFRTSSAPSR
jgi:hypothetical protein